MWSPSVMQSTPAADQLAIVGRRQPRAAGRVFGVGHDQVELLAANQSAERARNDLASRLADDIADQHFPHYSFHFRHPRFAQHGDFDLAGIGQLLLERLGDVAANLGGRGVGRVLGVDDHAQLAAGLDGEGLVDALESRWRSFPALPSA